MVGVSVFWAKRSSQRVTPHRERRSAFAQVVLRAERRIGRSTSGAEGSVGRRLSC